VVKLSFSAFGTVLLDGLSYFVEAMPGAAEL
jgi:hypothetical protein